MEHHKRPNFYRGEQNRTLCQLKYYWSDKRKSLQRDSLIIDQNSKPWNNMEHRCCRYINVKIFIDDNYPWQLIRKSARGHGSIIIHGVKAFCKNENFSYIIMLALGK